MLSNNADGVWDLNPRSKTPRPSESRPHRPPPPPPRTLSLQGTVIAGGRSHHCWSAPTGQCTPVPVFATRLPHSPHPRDSDLCTVAGFFALPSQRLATERLGAGPRLEGGRLWGRRGRTKASEVCKGSTASLRVTMPMVMGLVLNHLASTPHQGGLTLCISRHRQKSHPL